MIEGSVTPQLPQESPAPPQPAPTLIVRYGAMGLIGEFNPGNLDSPPPRGTRLVVLTERGMELGQVLIACGRGRPGCVSADQVTGYVSRSGPENCRMSAGKVLRLATAADQGEANHMARNSLEMKAYCQKRADEMNLPLRVVGVEHVFGGERAVFYFEADGRVDFRSLVKELAHEYQTRIEMRQIGARDEARLLADYEICGRECCCKNFLKNLKPVSMRMAKVQKATLDPTKVSGRCGRLRCCLRFENETYEALDRKLPPANSRVRVEQGVGVVFDRNVLCQLLVLSMEPEGNRLTVPAEAVLEFNVKAAPVPPREGPAPRAEPRSERENGSGRGGPRRRRGGNAPPGQRSEPGDAKQRSP